MNPDRGNLHLMEVSKGVHFGNPHPLPNVIFR